MINKSSDILSGIAVVSTLLTASPAHAEEQTTREYRARMGQMLTKEQTEEPHPHELKDVAELEALLAAPKPLVVNVDSTWCPACRHNFKVLQRIQEITHNGIHVVNLTIDRNPNAEILLARLGHPTVHTLPTTVIQNPDGTFSVVEELQTEERLMDFFEQALSQGGKSGATQTAEITELLEKIRLERSFRDSKGAFLDSGIYWGGPGVGMRMGLGGSKQGDGFMSGGLNLSMMVGKPAWGIEGNIGVEGGGISRRDGARWSLSAPFEIGWVDRNYFASRFKGPYLRVAPTVLPRQRTDIGLGYGTTVLRDGYRPVGRFSVDVTTGNGHPIPFHPDGDDFSMFVNVGARLYPAEFSD